MQKEVAVQTEVAVQRKVAVQRLSSVQVNFMNFEREAATRAPKVRINRLDPQVGPTSRTTGWAVGAWTNQGLDKT